MPALPASVIQAEPTRAELADAHMALQRLRLRHLPDDLDAALAAPLFGPLLRGMARDALRRRALQQIAAQPRMRFDARAAAAGDGSC